MLTLTFISEKKRNAETSQSNTPSGSTPNKLVWVTPPKESGKPFMHTREQNETPPLTQKRLREVLDYNKETGKFFWKVNIAKNVRMGREAGTIKDGYIYIRIDKRVYAAHRLAWLYHYGKWPEKEIDHINRNPQDNRLSNLRDVSKSENQRNSRASKKEDYGVYPYRQKSPTWAKYEVLFNRGKTSYHGGMFASKDEAIQAAQALLLKIAQTESE